MPNDPHIHYDVQHDGCIYNVGQWLDPHHRRMAISVQVLDDWSTAWDIAHLLTWRFENREASIIDALPLNGAATRE